MLYMMTEQNQQKALCVEDTLLLMCARTALSTDTAGRIRALVEQDIDWIYLIEIAGQHRTSSLLFVSLKTACPDHVPPIIFDLMRRDFDTTTKQNQAVTSEFLRILELLDAQGIPALPLKGPLLGELVYGNLALRQFDDLDILIHKQDFHRAKDILLARGYQPGQLLSPVSEIDWLDRHHDYTFVHDNGAVVVDLQWGIIEEPFRFPRDIDRTWTRLESVSFQHARVRNLRPEDLLLMLCVHGSKHLWGRLIWICDVAELARAYPRLNWDEVIHQAESTGTVRMLLLGLHLAHTLLDAPLPAQIGRKITDDPVVSALAECVLAVLFSGEEMLSMIAKEAPLFYLQMMERLGDRMRLIRTFYPSLLNPLRLLRTYGLRPLKHLLGA